MRPRIIGGSAWLMVGGAFLLLAGLGLDGLIHLRNPQLAATEGIFTLLNPGTVLLFLGIAATTSGALLFLLAQARGSWRRSVAFSGPIVLLVALAAGAGLVAAGGDGVLAIRHQHSTDHSHPDLAVATEAEHHAAADLLERTRTGSARFADFPVARQEGFRQITRYPLGGGTYGPAHFVSARYVADGRVLDPERPESLMYFRLPDGRMAFLGVMFLAPKGRGPTPGGPVTSWHSHDNLSAGANGILPKRDGGCPTGTVALTQEMMHVWLFDHPDGPFGHELNARALAAINKQIQSGQVPLSSGDSDIAQAALSTPLPLRDRLRALLGR